MVSPVTFRHAVGAREERGHRRPRLGRPGRARDRRRLVRGRARQLRLPVRRHSEPGSTSSTGSSRRSSASGPRADDVRPKPVAAAAPADHRRRDGEAADGRAPPIRYADEYNTIFPSVEEARERRDRRRRGRARRRPRAARLLDDDRLRRRPRRRRGPGAARGVAEGHARATTSRRSAGRWTRSPRGCATTRPSASSGRCSSTSCTRTSRWSRSSARSQHSSPRRLEA